MQVTSYLARALQTKAPEDVSAAPEHAREQIEYCRAMQRRYLQHGHEEPAWMVAMGCMDLEIEQSLILLEAGLG